MKTLQFIAPTAHAGQSVADYADWVDLYGTELYRLCRSLTFCVADAEDLFQDTFLEVFSQYHRGKSFSDLRKYLFSTAFFLWKSAKRKYARRQRIAPSEVMDDSIAASECFEDEVEDRQTQRQVRALVATLPDKLRIPVNLYYGAGMPLAEISETMGIAKGTLKSRLHKARELIAKGLGDI